MKQDFGAVIRARRKALGMNQFRLAEETGVSRNAVAGWETGHSRPDLATVPTLCEVLGISIEAFFGAEDPRAEEERRLLRLFAMLDERDRVTSGQCFSKKERVWKMAISWERTSWMDSRVWPGSAIRY